jgi:hypothetical protein
MITIFSVIEGVSPLLINRFKENDEISDDIKRSGKKDYGTPRSQAEQTAYRDTPSNILWIPSLWFKGALTAVSSDWKIPGSRKSVKSIIGGVVLPVNEKCFFKEKYTLSDIEVDSRPCVIQRARIMRHRARLEAWSIDLALEIDDELLSEDAVHKMLVEAGRRVGVGDYRPQKGGPFGRFRVISWVSKT